MRQETNLLQSFRCLKMNHIQLGIIFSTKRILFLILGQNLSDETSASSFHLLATAM